MYFVYEWDELKRSPSLLGAKDAFSMPLATVREKIVNNLCVGVLACYRKNCTSPNTAAGQVCI